MAFFFAASGRLVFCSLYKTIRLSSVHAERGAKTRVNVIMIERFRYMDKQVTVTMAAGPKKKPEKILFHFLQMQSSDEDMLPSHVRVLVIYIIPFGQTGLLR